MYDANALLKDFCSVLVLSYFFFSFCFVSIWHPPTSCQCLAGTTFGTAGASIPGMGGTVRGSGVAGVGHFAFAIIAGSISCSPLVCRGSSASAQHDLKSKVS